MAFVFSSNERRLLFSCFVSLALFSAKMIDARIELSPKVYLMLHLFANSTPQLTTHLILSLSASSLSAALLVSRVSSTALFRSIRTLNEILCTGPSLKLVIYLGENFGLNLNIIVPVSKELLDWKWKLNLVKL